MKPLEGIKVVDLTSYLAAPTTGRVLAEWGADVVKVESFGGDPARRQAGVFNMPMSDDENLAFDFANFGKKFMTLNLKSDTGLEVMLKLLASRRVLTSNRTKSLVKMGLTTTRCTRSSLKPRVRASHGLCGDKGLGGRTRPALTSRATWPAAACSARP